MPDEYIFQIMNVQICLHFKLRRQDYAFLGGPSIKCIHTMHKCGRTSSHRTPLFSIIIFHLLQETTRSKLTHEEENKQNLPFYTFILYDTISARKTKIKYLMFVF